MNKNRNLELEREIINHVETKAVVERFKRPGHISYFVKVPSPEVNNEGIPEKYYFEQFFLEVSVNFEKSNSLWNNTVDLNIEEEKQIKIKFLEIARKIIKDKQNPFAYRKEKPVVIYKVCPQMLCGDNPCSCKEYE